MSINQSRQIIVDDALRQVAVGRFADALAKSISSSRGILLSANLVALLLLSSLYNTLYSWNYTQQIRRAQLHAIVMAQQGDQKDKVESPIWFDAVMSSENDTELAYWRYLDAEGQKVAAQRELGAHIEREKDQDVFHLPFVNTNFASTDRTLIGGAALVLIGVWLIGSIGRQKTIIGEFLTVNGGARNATEAYKVDEHIFVLKAIRSEAAFARYPLLAGALFIIPPLSVLFCGICYLGVAASSGLGSAERTIIEVVAVFSVLIPWISVLFIERSVDVLVTDWEEAIARRQPAAASNPPI